MVNRFAVVAVLALFAAAPLAAGVQPTDQRLAERLTLRLVDFDPHTSSGLPWITDYPPSTRYQRDTRPRAEHGDRTYERTRALRLSHMRFSTRTRCARPGG
jgi:hypothetical protein